MKQTRTKPNVILTRAINETTGRPSTMNGKPEFFRNAKSALNQSEGFKEKLLCDGRTLSLGDACVAPCTYCYVPPAMNQLLGESLKAVGLKHDRVTIRRLEVLATLKAQLLNIHGRPRFTDPTDTQIVYSSPLVDCAGNLTLARETAEAATMIFSHTNWQLRLLSKFSFFPQLVEYIPQKYHHRLILGVSTGTLDGAVVRAIEPNTASIEQRLKSLHWLQDRGFRTFGMVCPSLPQTDYAKFARDIAQAVRPQFCEHIWAEAMNLRGESFTRTLAALSAAGLGKEMTELALVCGVGATARWEAYARQTFLAHVAVIPPEKLRFLQYVTADSRAWWHENISRGAVMLGCHAHGSVKAISPAPTKTVEVIPSFNPGMRPRKRVADKIWKSFRLGTFRFQRG